MLEKQYGAWRTGRWSADYIGPANFYSGNASVARAHLVATGGFEFERTVSRLQEMRSAEYLALPHGHGRSSGDSSGLVET